MSTPQTFRKKPVEIQSVQLSWRTWDEVCEFVDLANNPLAFAGRMIDPSEASDMCGEVGQAISFDVTTTHGERAVVRHGDWIIPDSKPGTFYPCKPDIFAATYDPV